MTATKAMAALARPQDQTERWHACQVATTNGDGTVDIAYFDTIVDHVSCLNGFVPSVDDLVLVLASNEIGWIVFGRIPKRSVTPSDA